MKLAIGKNSLVPSGMVHSLTALPETSNVPPRYQMVPDWPALQSAVSKRGFMLAGSEKAHCHHFALSSLYEFVLLEAMGESDLMGPAARANAGKPMTTSRTGTNRLEVRIVPPCPP